MTALPPEVTPEQIRRQVDAERHFAANYERNVGLTVQELERVLDSFRPEVSITLGTGLGGLAEHIEAVHVFDLNGEPDVLPHVRRPTVEGHAGKWIFGHLAGVPVVAMSGRTHYYEVARQEDAVERVIFPVDVMASLGVKAYFGTHAAGGLDDRHEPGAIQIISDQIYLGLTGLPIVLAGNPKFGTKEPFVNMSVPYHEEFTDLLTKAAATVASRDWSTPDVEESPTYSTQFYSGGTLSGVTGRDFETPAEVLFLRSIGANTVGMSMMMECKAARARDLPYMGFSLVTDTFDEQGKSDVSHDYVLGVAKDPVVQARLQATVTEFLTLYSQR